MRSCLVTRVLMHRGCQAMVPLRQLHVLELYGRGKSCATQTTTRKWHKKPRSRRARPMRSRVLVIDERLRIVCCRNGMVSDILKRTKSELVNPLKACMAFSPASSHRSPLLHRARTVKEFYGRALCEDEGVRSQPQPDTMKVSNSEPKRTVN